MTRRTFLKAGTAVVTVDSLTAPAIARSAAKMLRFAA
jgi:hypothetical protein